MYLQRNHPVWYKLYVIYNCKHFLKVSSWELRSLDKLDAVFSLLQSFQNQKSQAVKSTQEDNCPMCWCQPPFQNAKSIARKTCLLLKASLTNDRALQTLKNCIQGCITKISLKVPDEHPALLCPMGSRDSCCCVAPVSIIVLIAILLIFVCVILLCLFKDASFRHLSIHSLHVALI